MQPILGMKKYILTVFGLLTASFIWAAVDTVKVPIHRIINHDKINKEQQLLDKLDGKADNYLKLNSEEDINLAIGDAIFREVDMWQDSIELNASIVGQQQKVKYLFQLEQLLRNFRLDIRAKLMNPLMAPALLKAYGESQVLDVSKKSIAPVVERNSYEVGRSILVLFADNVGFAESKKINYLKYTSANPTKIMNSLGEYAAEPFADSLLSVAAKKNPMDVYNYATAKNALGKLIRNSSNVTVNKIVVLANRPNALLYFPFIDDIITGKKSIDSLQRYIGNGEKGYDSVGYYKQLVQTEISYYKRMEAGDTAVAYLTSGGLRDMLTYKANQHFVTIINELHEKPESVRMRSVEPLNSVDLYFMIIMGEQDIYTSSYKHSFNRLIARLGKQPRTDSLLNIVGYDFFKRFIKMAANFNRLDTFLKLMPAEQSAKIMRRFVDNLDKAEGLEDAVDVADSYSSINSPALKKTLLKYVDENYAMANEANSARGMAIYQVLKDILLSADSTTKTDLTKLYGISSIYNIPLTELQDDSGRIIQQVFFYGDDDGKAFFPKFLTSFNIKEWQITPKKEWYEIKSIKGKKIWIFVNRPLDSDKNLDDTAQINLIAYMTQQGLTPSVVVHRGHSYWLPGTLNRMPDDTKLIVLGSCGGYKNLSKILRNSPAAHIISTKEIGVGDINRPILNYLNQTFQLDTNLDWQKMWRSLSSVFAKEKNTAIRESWDNYIPPYKNLGAIFIKAYNKKMGNN